MIHNPRPVVMLILPFVVLASSFMKLAEAEEPLVSRPVGWIRITVPAQSDSLAALPYEPLADSLDEWLHGQLSGSSNMNETDWILTWDA